MKKKILSLIGIGLLVGISVNIQLDSNSSKLTLKNIEGLSGCENSTMNKNGHCVGNIHGVDFCARPEGATIDCVQ